ncbi:MAG: hypothetical protein K6G15_02815 [Desulfovibrio sp.]|nr:hypothetical protein [Desulfovibrio sp.]
MSLPSYVVSALEGRVRLRHAVFKTAEGQQKALEVLSKQKKVREVRQGAGSLLLFFDPTLSLASLLASLEKEIPELAAQAVKDKEKSLVPQCLEQLFGVNLRKIENRSLLLLLGLAALFGFVGSGSAHLAISTAVLVLLGRHVWVRRAAL